MFGIGMLEILIICVVGVVFIGPKNLPKVMVELGKFFVQVRRVTNEVRDSVNDAVREANMEDIKTDITSKEGAKDFAKDKFEEYLGTQSFDDSRESSQKKKPTQKKKL